METKSYTEKKIENSELTNILDFPKHYEFEES